MADPSWLILRLEAPLVAFGGVTIDQVGVTRNFPAASMMTGLLANALGYRRQDWKRHQSLQDRLVFAARWDRQIPVGPLTDVQNARLAGTDKGWTTWGTPEGRDGASYAAPHRRRRDYHADACVTVALRLEPSDPGPGLTELSAAIDRPARPLFVGRKTCLPTAPLRASDPVSAPSAYVALQHVPANSATEQVLRALWPLEEGPVDGDNVDRIIDLADLRNWRTGLHGGTRRVVEGNIIPVESTP